MADVVIDRVTKRFGDIEATSDVSLTIPNGELAVLLGPTGAGKTTLLRLVAALEKPDAGVIQIDGRDVTNDPPALRDVSFVFQQYSLYPHLTVYDNLAFPLRAPARRVDETEIKKRVEQVARLVRIDHKLSNAATRLSGGEMQRVAIGRALVRRPSIYLMDEPLSSLDAKLRAELRVELKHIQADLGATILYVTHDQTEAMTLASRIGILDRGRLVQVGTPHEIYERPVNAYVAARLGSPAINLLPVEALPANGAPTGTVSVGARTEHIELTPADDGPAEVVLVEHLGSENFLHLRMNGQHLVTLVPPGEQWHPGSRARLALNGPLYFDAAGKTLAGAH
jgi:multiple sugar transport system ATP-binding protein